MKKLLLIGLFLTSMTNAFSQEFRDADALEKILELQSLSEMNKLLPEEFLNIRNLFQVLLAETIYSLMCVKE